jgi:hypothetical protein
MRVSSYALASLTALIFSFGVSCSSEYTCHDAWSEQAGSRRIVDLSVAMHRGETVSLKIDIYFEVVVCEIRDIDKKLILSSLDPDLIDKEIDLLRSSFAPMNVDFFVNEVHPLVEKICVNNASDIEKVLSEKITEVMNRDDEASCDQKAMNNKRSCSIFFQFSIGKNYAGLSKMPYWENCRGIRICGPSIHDYLLAHEMGHYFGLQHTFMEGGDNIPDTPNGPILESNIGTLEDPNFHNIMTYSPNGVERHFTKDQMEYMRKCILGFRYDEMYMYIDTNWKNKKVSEMVEDAIFNIK